MKRRILTGLLTLLMALSLAACGGGAASGAASADTSAPAHSGGTMNMAITESVEPQESLDDGGYGANAQYDTAAGERLEEESQESGRAAERKFIITAWLELETTSFDQAVQGLTELTQTYGGWYESSSVANRTSGSRWADYTVRIPAERYEAFLNQAGALCHETWREATQDEITEAYYDTQGRLKTQQIKLERLQALLAKAELMEDIITIESAISETEWQIEELSGTLRHYDSQVDYATVHISLREVYRYSDVEQVPDSFASRMSAAFSGGLRSFSNNLENLAVGFAYSWMWWLLAAVVIVVIVRLLRRRWRAAAQPGDRPPFWTPHTKEAKKDEKKE